MCKKKIRCVFFLFMVIKTLGSFSLKVLRGIKPLICIYLELFAICLNLSIYFIEFLISFFSVKSCFQNMEICKRRVHMYDTVSQIKSPFTTHVAPNTSTNLTMSFSNQLNTVHNQVFSK